MDSNCNLLRYDELVDKIQDMLSNDMDLKILKEALNILSSLESKCHAIEGERYVDKALLENLVAISSYGEVLKKCLIVDFGTAKYTPQTFYIKCMEKFGNLCSPKLMNIARNFVKEPHELKMVYELPAVEGESIVARQRQQRKAVAEKVTVAVEAATSKEHSDNIDIILQHILKVLIKVYMELQIPLDFQKFVIDKSSFAATVENIFHTSLLYKQRKVDIFSEDDILKIVPTTKQQTGNDNLKKFIVNITMDEWRKASFPMGYLEKYK